MSRKIAALALALVVGAWVVPRPALAVSEPDFAWRPANGKNYTPHGNRKIDLIVIHKTDGTYEGSIGWFRNPAAGVSAHWITSHSGAITHLVSDRDVAWHSGNWSYNQRSIGIENEGWTYRDDMPDVQVRALARLVAWLCVEHSIPADRSHIIGHAQVPGQDHTDPGPHFPWTRFMGYVQAELAGGAPPRPPVATSGARAVEVTAGLLNVREHAWGAITGLADRGAVYALTGRREGDFQEIWYRGRRAFVHAGFVRASFGTGGAVLRDHETVRVGPRTSDGSLGQVDEGQLYADAGAASAAWRLIWFDQRRAWIPRASLRDVRFGD